MSKHSVDENGFYVLIPRKSTGKVTKSNKLLGMGEPWIDTPKEETVEDLRRQLADKEAIIAAILAAEDRSDEALRRLCGKTKAPKREGKKRGFFGLYVNGKTDPREWLPEVIRDIDGVNLNFNPGQGISITPHYRTREAT